MIMILRWKCDHCLMVLTPSRHPLPHPLPLILNTYNFKQLWRFLCITVIIKLLCGHWTDVCSQGRGQYETNPGTCVSHFERVIPVFGFTL